MLTRLEVDGFKNLLDFSIEFGPYTCVAGANGVGKSNIFDAICFLAEFSRGTLAEAVTRTRAVDAPVSDPSAIFWNGAPDGSRQIRLAAEMIVPASTTDDLGRERLATSTFLRYEVTLIHEPGDVLRSERPGGIRLEAESLVPLSRGDVGERLPWLKEFPDFRDALVLGDPSHEVFISTTAGEGGRAVVREHPAGATDGAVDIADVASLPRTVLSTASTVGSAEVLAARNEMRGWNLLALEPTAMRTPDRLPGPASVTPRGAHLPATLMRLAATSDGRALERVAASAAALADIRDVTVEYDNHRELVTLHAAIGSGPAIPARSLSDGTLRFLALCILAEDPESGGVLCIEEPENGVHPARMSALGDLLAFLAVDPHVPVDAENPLRQVIVNTHSPGLVQLQQAQDLVVIGTAVLTRNSRAVTIPVARPLRGTWRDRGETLALSPDGLADYLTDESTLPDDGSEER